LICKRVKRSAQNEIKERKITKRTKQGCDEEYTPKNREYPANTCTLPKPKISG
jgi:hypothetical protein